MNELVITSIVSFVLGFVTNLFTDWFKKIYNKHSAIRNDKKSKKDLFNYNPETDDLFVINRWSLERRLTPATLQMTVTKDRPKQMFIPKAKLERGRLKQIQQNRTGDICYMTDYNIDHKESDYGKIFRMEITHCDYAEHMAAYEYVSAHPDVANKIRRAMLESPKEYLKHAIPANITVNLLVISESCFLASYRSNSVDTLTNVWTVGAFETMQLKKDTMSVYHENLFELTRRGLMEELNLSSDNYGEIFISWIGLYVPNARTHVVATVKIKDINEGQLIQAAANAHSNFEANAFEWLPLNYSAVKQWINSKEGPMADRNWSMFSALALQEIFRIKNFL